jgi:4'-phosphopantetheinyl transferase EntD
MWAHAAEHVVDVNGTKIRWNCAERGKLVEQLLEPRAWLSAAEVEEFSSLRGNRASAWLAGRALAKCALLAEGVADDARMLTVLSTDGRGARNRPEVYVGGYSRGISLSLAHSDSFVAVAWASADTGLGVDVVEPTRLSPAFKSAWLHPSEQEQSAGSEDNFSHSHRIWSAKEAAYKAAQTGETFDPLRMEVALESPTRGSVQYRGNRSQLQTCDVLWQPAEDVLITISKVRCEPHGRSAFPAT